VIADLAMRPRRKTPSVKRIAEFWECETDRCCKCRGFFKGLERAHLVDRCYGGLDGVQNLALLCWECHGMMPSFKPEREDDAYEYAFCSWREGPWHRKVRKELSEVHGVEVDDLIRDNWGPMWGWAKLIRELKLFWASNEEAA